MGHMGAAMGHACAHTWGMYGSSNGACIRAYMAMYGGIHGSHGSSNGACMRAYMGHIWEHTWVTWEQQWGMHARIHGPYMGAYMGHMGAAIGHACAYTWPYMGQPYRESREEGNSR